MTAFSADAAEARLLATLLHRSDFIGQISRLEPGDFGHAVRGALFGEIAARAQRGEAVTVATLEVWLQSAGIPYETMMALVAGTSPASRGAIAALEATILDASARRKLDDLLANARERLAKSAAADVSHEIETKLRELQFGGRTGRDLYEGGQALMEQLCGPQHGLSTGFEALDERLGGLFPQEFILIGGRPSQGKTALATNIVRNVARRGGRVHMASYEMSAESLAARSVAAAAYEAHGQRFAYSRLRRGRGTDVDLDYVRALAQRLPRSVIIDDGAAQTISRLKASVRETRRRLGGLDLIVVDYLQLMRADTKSRYDTITEISQGLKALAKDERVPLVALSQLSRANEQREDKRPQLADLRESGSLEQDADVVLGIYREAYYLERAEPQLAQFSATTNKDGKEIVGAAANYDIAYQQWEDKLRAVKNDMEVITLKQRSGSVGTDRLVFHPEYDVALDGPPRSLHQSRSQS